MSRGRLLVVLGVVLLLGIGLGAVRGTRVFQAREADLEENFFVEAGEIVCLHRHFGTKESFRRALDDWMELAVASGDAFKIEGVQRAQDHSGELCGGEL